ncbi:MAG TPA: phosphatase PAP2 family protein [Nevskiaceae bacterium]|nr:phosphatase PAP2 family protein [Nevskiaceae bacterium]
MRNRLAAAIAALMLLYGGQAAANNGPDIAIGDALTGIVPLGALGIAYFSGDTEGVHQWVRNTAINQTLISVLRLGFNQTSLGRRPNGGKYGFPSGHEAFVMSGAAFLGERYTWELGLPAYLAAGYVGYVRVHEDKHHWRDVIASGAISYGIALVTVTPEHATHIAPIVGPNWLGLRFERSF